LISGNDVDNSKHACRSSVAITGGTVTVDLTFSGHKSAWCTWNFLDQVSVF